MRIYLCHANEDRHQVREIYQRLRAEGFDPWLDEEDLLPGQNWEHAVIQALRESDFVLIFLSRHLVSQRIHLQRDLKLAFDILAHTDESIIHTIPVRLEDYGEIPEQLRSVQWVNLFDSDWFDRLVQALKTGIWQRLHLEPTSSIS